MSRGLSRQQRQILGLAVGLARRRHRNRKLITADSTDEPDITVAFAAVVVGGVALVPEVRPSGDYGRQIISQDRSPAGLSARASIDRAFGSLMRRGLLVPCDHQSRDRPDKGHYRGRYHLTEAGIATGLQYEAPITEEMRPVFWLLDRSTDDVGVTDHPVRLAYQRRAVLAHESAAPEL
jgi:hypothetical protein